MTDVEKCQEVLPQTNNPVGKNEECNNTKTEQTNFEEMKTPLEENPKKKDKGKENTPILEPEEPKNPWKTVNKDGKKF